MPNAIAQLVAVLLLITQAVAALGPGRVLCVPVSGPGVHALGKVTHGDDCDHHRAAVCLGATVEGASACGDHDHGMVVALLHPHDDCGCHIHVPVRPSDTMPTTPRDRNAEASSIPVPVVVALVLNLNAAAPGAVRPQVDPPDRSRAAATIALKSTRLRV